MPPAPAAALFTPACRPSGTATGYDVARTKPARELRCSHNRSTYCLHVGDGPALAKIHEAPLYGPAALSDTLVALGELLERHAGAQPEERLHDCLPRDWHTPLRQAPPGRS